MTDLRTDLAALLAPVTRGGAFATHGRVEAPSPALTVEGVGRVALPLLPLQLPALVGVAERAPYGKGTHTLIDPAVRRTWQIGAGSVRLEGRRWAETLEAIVSRAVEGLGVSGPVEASLYKLLVYDDGSFFVDHRDTEKAPGMFATLVVLLPADFEGGELVVRHGGATKTFDLRPQDSGELTFAAFYADCLHEVRPITRGCRLALIYNLVRTGRGALPTPPAYSAEADAVAERLWDWDDGPDRLVLPLDHAYSPAELAPAALKGRDAAVAEVVFTAARAADCEAILALLTIEEFGWAQYTGWGRGSRGRYGDLGDADFAVGEVTDHHAWLEHGCDAEGRRLKRGRSRLDLDELCPPGVFDDAEPEELSFTEATGNAGASFERTYHRAALVVWQKRRTDAVIANDGPAVSVPHLTQLVARGGDPRPLAELVMERWPGHAYTHAKMCAAPGAQLLECLLGAGALDLAERYLKTVTAAVGFGEVEVPAILAVLGRLRANRADDAMAAIVTARMLSAPGPTARLFCRFADLAPEAASDAAPGRAAHALAACLPGRQTPPAAEAWRTSSPATPDVVADVLAGLSTLGAEAALQSAVDHMVADTAHFPLDASLIPGVIECLGRRGPGAGTLPTPLEAARSHCLASLRSRISLALAPPETFARASKLSCTCRRGCAEASVFLADPTRAEWFFRAHQEHRRHVEAILREAEADVDCETLRSSSPHVLVCRKNQRSYLRRVAERKQDLERLAALGG